MYDLIGDIHGQALELEALLEKLGYENDSGTYRHAERTVIFLGDFVDRGEHQRRVIELARKMIGAGSALSVMGNHEYNAIAYYTKGDDGSYLRKRNDKNNKQHKEFLEEYESDPVAYSDVIDWFKTLPLWLDLEGLRVVHACWDPEFIEKIQDAYDGSNVLNDAFLHASADRSTWQYEAIETLLKGKEAPLPKGVKFPDKGGHSRHEIRVRWWDKPSTYREAYIGPPQALTHIPDDPIGGDHLIEYSTTEKPVFLGHYWLDGEPEPLAKNIACLDYSVANKGGKLVAYRWGEEIELDANNFVSVKRLDAV